MAAPGTEFVYTLRNGTTITPLTFERGNPRILVGARVSVTGIPNDTGLRVQDAKGGDVDVRREAKVEALGTWTATPAPATPPRPARPRRPPSPRPSRSCS